MQQPDVCPLILHDRVLCEKSNLKKGKEKMCLNLDGEKYTKCPCFSQWYWRQHIKESKGAINE
jgi:hypothetical protein